MIIGGCRRSPPTHSSICLEFRKKTTSAIYFAQPLFILLFMSFITSPFFVTYPSFLRILDNQLMSEITQSTNNREYPHQTICSSHLCTVDFFAFWLLVDKNLLKIVKFQSQVKKVKLQAKIVKFQTIIVQGQKSQILRKKGQILRKKVKF